MKISKLSWIYFLVLTSGLILITGCGTLEVGVETNSPITTPFPVDILTEESIMPTETVPPSPTETSSPPEATNAPPVPDLVTIAHLTPFASMDIGVLVLENGKLTVQPSPVYQEIFWDYDRASGKLAYSPDFFHSSDKNNLSVSSLWVYDYATETSQMWLGDNVLRASWSPDGERVTAAVYNPEKEQIDLVFVSGPDQVEPIAECASNLFSWSPDGDMLAYVNAVSWVGVKESCAGTYLVSFPNGIQAPERDLQRISDFGSEALLGHNYVDKPLWVMDQSALIFPDQPFWVVPFDGSPALVPATPNGEDPLEIPRPFGDLWAPDLHQLIGNYDAGISGQGGVWVYQLSEDLHQIENYYRIGDIPQGENSFITLVDWWKSGESILVLDGDNSDTSQALSEMWSGPAVWSLPDKQWVKNNNN
jgi:hypothetical protein